MHPFQKVSELDAFRIDKVGLHHLKSHGAVRLVDSDLTKVGYPGGVVLYRLQKNWESRLGSGKAGATEFEQVVASADDPQIRRVFIGCDVAKVAKQVEELQLLQCSGTANPVPAMFIAI